MREIVADEYGGNRPLLGSLGARGASRCVRHLPGPEHGGGLLHAPRPHRRAGAYRHLGQVELLSALRGARAKPVGDAWCWSRKASSGDASTVVALTLALAVGSELEVGASDFTIY